MGGLINCSIMHSGTLDLADIERLGMNMRDWIRQIGV
jgi:hypothetical protein